MIATSMNITSVTIDAAIGDAGLTVCESCFVAVPIISGACERCA